MTNSELRKDDLSLKMFLAEKEFWLLVLLGILYFYRPLFLNESFFFRDLVLNIFPQKQLLTDFFQARELPLWTPYIGGGRPYLADIPYFTLYPSNLLYAVLSPLRAFNINIVLHVIGTACCAYLFGRTLGLKPLASFISGLVYGFCGYTLSLANHGCRLLSMPYLPLLLLFWHCYLCDGKRKYFVFAVIAGALQVFSGTSEMNVITLLFVAGWTLFYPYPKRTMIFKIVLWGLLAICIIGVASIQIVPTAEMLGESMRQGGLDYDTFTKWSLNPRRLPELLFPNFFGYVDTVFHDTYYWGSRVLEEEMPYILSIYFGWGAFVLAVLGAFSTHAKHILPFKSRMFLLLVFLLSLLLSLGRFLPYFSLVYSYVPLISIFRYPIKFLLVGLFPLALLSGYGSEIFFGTEPVRQENSASRNRSARIGSIVLWGISGSLIILTLLTLLSSGFVTVFSKLMFHRVGGEELRQGLLGAFAHAAGISFLIVLLYHYRQITARRWQFGLLACVLTLDLLVAGGRINFYAPATFFTEIPDSVRVIRENIGEGRLCHTGSDFSKLELLLPPDDIDTMWKYRWHLEMLTGIKPVLYGIPVVFHDDVDGLDQRYIVRLSSLIKSLPWSQKLPVFSAGGVTLILTTEDKLAIPGIQRITEIPNHRSNISLFLYRNMNAAARIQFVMQGRIADSDEEALEMMLSPGYDPRKHVVLQYPESSLFARKTKKSEKTPEIHASSADRSCPPADILTSSSSMQSVTLEVSSQCDGYLVFSEAYYPGWKVLIDGEATPVFRANYAFSAISLPAGTHSIERVYHPNSVLIGAIVSLMFCGILGLIAWKG